VRPPRRATINITHDVDAPFKYAFVTAPGMARSLLAEMARARSIRPLAGAFGNWRAVRAGDVAADPYNRFAWMMDQAEAVGAHCTFYVIAGKTAGRIDGDYDVEDPAMMALWASILARGHRLALHPSYGCFRSFEALHREKARLERLLSRLGAQEPLSEVRMHYLRFDPLRTPALLQEAGFRCDSSLGFADRHGFRRGTCRPFRLWDLQASRPLQLIERPLLIMDASLFAVRYQQFGAEQAGAAFTALSAWCRRMAGEMTMLWHNNFYCEDWQLVLYRHCLEQWRAA
jgi:hypothetical protein